MLGKSGIICATTLNPASLAMLKLSQTALTVCPRFVSLAMSSYTDCTPVLKSISIITTVTALSDYNLKTNSKLFNNTSCK